MSVPPSTHPYLRTTRKASLVCVPADSMNVVGSGKHRPEFPEPTRAFGKSSDRAGAVQQALALIAKVYRVESQLGGQRETDPAAKANGREPYWYLRELFEALPTARTRADYLALIPAPRPPPSRSP